MLFNSATYLFLFLPVVVTGYWLAPQRIRLWIILFASMTFYAFWRIEFVPLLLFSALIDYWIALRIHRERDQSIRLRWLRISICVNLGVLGFFKYLVFFRDSIWSIAEGIGYQPSFTELNIILPLGISFYIFQTMSYTIDVYRREFEPEKDALTYMCFVTFFPQLVAGPILRAHTLIPQLTDTPTFQLDKIRRGIERVIAGLFMKVVLADTIAGFVDQGFERNIQLLSALDGWTLSFLFGFQIYFDFAGYSSIAIGSALLLGLSIPENFDFPYAATSPRDFWKRWHISLSTWIRDYVYLPIIGAYKPQNAAAWDTLAEAGETNTGAASIKFRRTWGLYATWGIMGLWHGANWTFVVWGLYHAVMVHLHRIVSPRLNMPGGFLGWCLALGLTLPIMMAGWIPFRAPSVADTFILWGKMINPYAYGAIGLSPNSYLLAAMLVIGVTLRWAWTEYGRPVVERRPGVETVLATGFHAVTIAFVFVFLQVKQQFIYFQF